MVAFTTDLATLASTNSVGTAHRSTAQATTTGRSGSTAPGAWAAAVTNTGSTLLGDGKATRHTGFRGAGSYDQLRLEQERVNTGRTLFACEPSVLSA